MKKKKEPTEQRPDQLKIIHKMVLELASGNLGYRASPCGPREDLDSILSGINMLGEELQASTVSLEYLKSIYKGIVDMCIVLTPEKLIKSVNTPLTKLLQYEEKHLLGKPFNFLYKDEMQPSESQVYEALYSRGFFYNINTHFITSQGKGIPVLCSCSLLYDNKKNITGILYIAKDVSEQKKYEEALHQRKELFELALRASNDGIWDWDLQNQNYYFSTRWKAMLGYKPNELADTLDSWDQTIHPEDKVAALQQLEDFNQGKTSEFNAIHRYYHKNGSILYMFSRCIHHKDSEGNILRMIWAHTDITFQKMTELELKNAKEQAEAANLAKSDFLANIGHEIGTPLNSIIGLTEQLLSSDLNEELREYLSMIEISGKNLSRLLLDLLDLNKIETGKLVLDNEIFNFTHTISSALKPYEFMAQEKGLNFSIHFDKSIAMENFQGDPFRIVQILINLITNSIKFTSEGTIKISFRLVKDAALKKDEAYIQGVVADSGRGISPEKQGIIFNRFEQGDQIINRNFGGSGLGLVIVKQLVDLMEGEVSVVSPAPYNLLSSEPGTEFRFLIKVKKVFVEKVKNEVVLNKTGKQLVLEKEYKILMVEDNEMNQYIANKTLKEIGFEVEFVNNGLKAVEVALNKDFDLILMDTEMPVMNGIEAIKMLREKFYTKPILIILSDNDKEVIAKGLEAGMNGYIEKPFEKTVIFDAISKVLN